MPPLLFFGVFRSNIYINQPDGIEDSDRPAHIPHNALKERPATPGLEGGCGTNQKAGRNLVAQLEYLKEVSYV